MLRASAGFKWTFRNYPTDAALIVIQYAVEKRGFTKFAVLSVDSDYRRVPVDFTKKYLPGLKGAILTEDYYREGEVDFRSVLAKIRDSGAQAIIMYGGHVRRTACLMEFYSMWGAFRRILTTAAMTFLVASTAQAQSWPQRSTTLIHGFGAGGNAGSISRLVANALSESLGVSVIVDAKPGAGGNIASEFVSRAASDGYTLILLTGGHAVSAALYKKLRFNPVDSFTFVSLVGTFPFVVATRADSPVADLASLIATIRQQPGKLSFSSVGFGSTQHLTGELLALSAGGKLTHMAGQIDLIVDTITVTGPAIKAGTLKGLGVSSASPWPSLPGVPTIASQLPGFDVKSWIGIALPAGAPSEIVSRLHEAVGKVVNDPEFQKRLDLLGVRAGSSTPEAMKAFVASEVKRWNEVIADAGLEKID
jgi:tripartite-type tricarboxylate transporter receptor subunit TctC